MSQKLAKDFMLPEPALDISTAAVTGTLPIANGGTGGTTDADARTNLGLGALATASTVDSTGLFGAGAAATTADKGVVTLAAHGSATAGSVVQADDPDVIRRMTEAARDLIAAPEDGRIIYNTTTHRLNFYDGGSGTWTEVAVSVD